MLFSENVYFLILFTLPAALNVVYNAHIRHTPIAKNDKSVELAECIIFCLAVSLINVIYIQKDMLLFTKYSLLEKEGIEEFCNSYNFDYVLFMTRYFIVNIFSSILVIIGWYLIGQKIFRCVKNALNWLRKRPKELKFSDVWSNLFETNQIVDISNCIIKIERSGKLVSAGLIQSYSSPNKQNKEFVLYNTDLIKQLFEDDEKLSIDLRMFKQTLCEYYEIQSDTLIKFYDTDVYDLIYAQREK